MADSSYSHPIHLGQAIGIELEYMLVDATTLEVRPIADELIRVVSGAYGSDVEPDGPEGAIAWSNELALHVIELKTQRPVAALEPLIDPFAANVRRIAEVLTPMGACLMPTAMHPWMDPHRELRLWPHEYGAVYEAFDRIFSCRAHGWANVQSIHINLPFGNDAEFGRLHAAMRLVLPLVPALAAASPFADGVPTGSADTRMEAYRRNSKRVPSVGGDVIPEPVFTRAEYRRTILERIYRDIAPHDPDDILRHEWLNARGCIARFDRGSIEMRVIDSQECPTADMAVSALVIGAVNGLLAERWMDLAGQQRWSVGSLRRILQGTAREAERFVIENAGYLEAFGMRQESATAGELWRHIGQACMPAGGRLATPIRRLLESGPLARRILQATGPAPSRECLAAVYRELCGCLVEDRMFEGVSVEA